MEKSKGVVVIKELQRPWNGFYTTGISQLRITEFQWCVMFLSLFKNCISSLAKFKGSVGGGSSYRTFDLTSLLGQLPFEPWNNGAYERSPALSK